MNCPKCGKEMINNKCVCGYSEPIKFSGFGEVTDNREIVTSKETKVVMEDLEIPTSTETVMTADEMLKKTKPSFMENTNPFIK